MQSRRRAVSTWLAVWTLVTGSTFCLAQNNFPEQEMDCNDAGDICIYHARSGHPRYFLGSELYEGWKIFRAYCNACHVDGGSEVHTASGASDARLTEKIGSGELSRDSFRKTVLYGRPIRGKQQSLLDALKWEVSRWFQQGVETTPASSSGQIWMPAWHTDPIVSKNMDNIYAYLERRAAGDIPVRPGQIHSKILWAAHTPATD